MARTAKFSKGTGMSIDTKKLKPLPEKNEKEAVRLINCLKSTLNELEVEIKEKHKNKTNLQVGEK